jgi:hypothetical protein
MKFIFAYLLFIASIASADLMVTSAGDTVYIYKSTWVAIDKTAHEWFVYSDRLRASRDGETINVTYETTPGEFNLNRIGNPIAVLKEVHFFEEDSSETRLGIRRITVGVRFTGRTDDNHFVLSDVHCDTTNTPGKVYGTRDHGKALCSSHVRIRTNRQGKIDSMVSNPEFFQTLPSREINVLPMTGGRVYIRGESMLPSLINGAGYPYIAVSPETKLGIGDIVVYRHNNENNTKRISATPGLLIRNLNFPLPPDMSYLREIPENMYYLVADNPNFAASETHGLVSRGNIIAKVVVSK